MPADSQDSEVQILDDAADLSEGAQAKLLKSLLAEKQQLAQQVASLQKKTGGDKRTKRPVYWRRDGDGKRLPDDAGVDEKLLVELTPGSDEYESGRRALAEPRPARREHLVDQAVCE